MSDTEEEPKEEPTIQNDTVKTKYKNAADIVNAVLKDLCAQCKAGKTPVELCELGDAAIAEQVKNVFNKFDSHPTKKIVRGLAFPTCVSVNHLACHYSPLAEAQVALKAGDVVKIDLGAHVDGFAAVAAHTVIVQEEETPITGQLADLVQAAQLMIDVAARCMVPSREKKNNDISALWQKIADAYGVSLCEGILSHQLKRYVLDGSNCIILKPSVERRVEDVSFASGQVWTIDIVLSTGKGKLIEGDTRPCVFRRNPDEHFSLKLRASKDVLKDINTRFQTFPFTVRALDPKTGRLGLNECARHDLVVPYPVLAEKPGEMVVHFKRTLFVLKRVEMVAGLEPTQKFESDKKCEDPDVLGITKLGLGTVKKPSKPKPKASTDGAAAAAAPPPPPPPEA